MKNAVYALAFLLGSQAFCAQAWQGNGDQKIQVGLNGWTHGRGLTATYDYGVANIVSVGAGVNLYFNGYKEDHQTILFGRLNAHLQDVFNMDKKWDVYPGLDIGILGNTLALGAHLGARYFFDDHIGAFIEAGNYGSVGVAYNF